MFFYQKNKQISNFRLKNRFDKKFISRTLIHHLGIDGDSVLGHTTDESPHPLVVGTSHHIEANHHLVLKGGVHLQLET